MVPHPASLLGAFLAALFCSLVSVAQPMVGQAPAGSVALTLGAAEARLEQGNREIIAARQELEVTRTGVISAGARPNPVLSTSITSINPVRGIGGGPIKDKQVDSVVRLDQLIERGGKRELRIASAEHSVAAAEQDLQEVRRQQRLALHLTYYDLKAAGERLAISRENSRQQAQALQAAERRLTAGDVAAAEVVRLRVEALRADNEAGVAASDLVRSRQALAMLLGGDRGPAEAWQAADAWPADLPGLPGSADAAARLEDPETVAQRPGVRAAQFRVAAAERARELARQLRTRDISVGAQVERFPPEAGLSYGVSISVPLQTNYRYEGEIARAEADLTAAMLARDREAMLALSEARRALSEAQAAAERRTRLATEILPQARRVLESAEFAYQRGAIGLLDLLDARRTLRIVELEAAGAAADFARARAGWIAATAGPAAAAMR